MDLSPPPLSQSPSSPSNTYCPSERSSLDYPSPSLVEQQYKLSPIYGTDAPCSMAPSPPLDTMSHSPEWTTTTIIHPSSSATAMPSIISGEYETYGGYESGLPTPYAHDLYHSHHAHTPSLAGTPPPSGPSSRSPIPSSARSPFPLTPRMKLEGDYGQGMGMSHYPSPRSVQSVPPSLPTSYATDASAYASTPGYMSDTGSTGWQKSDYQPVEPEQFYTAPSTHASAFIQDHRRGYRIQRPRRAPRRLTTKEEANFQCDIKGCGKLFSRSYNFKAHMETHDDKREYPFPCLVPDCNKKFVRKTDLQRHHSSVHAKERNHKCDYCNRMFARKDTLRRYVRQCRS
jgi:hypothetical protein